MRRSIACFALLAPLAVATSASAQAQDPTPGTTPPIELDGSIGPGGDVPFDGTTWAIGDPLGKYNQSGSALFHSFGRFDVPAGQTAEFSAAHGSPQRVFARVTWGEVSDIEGTLRSTIPGADLYLINPAGVRFGGGARLDVQGSFVATSAGRIDFRDGESLTANPADPPPLLSLAEPSSFGFLPAGGGTIEFDQLGTPLSVPQGETFAAVGGGVRIRGTDGRATLSAPGSLLALVAAGPNVVVPADLVSFDPAAVPSGISLGDVDVAIKGNLFASSPVSGSIVVRGGNFTLSGSQLQAVHGQSGNSPYANAVDIAVRDALRIEDSSRILAGTAADGRGGDVRLAGGSIEIARSDVDVRTTRGGPGSDVFVHTGSLSLSNGGRILSEALGSAPGGAVHVEAESIDASDAGFSTTGTAIASTTVNFLGGAAGRIDIEAERISLRDGAQIFSSTSGSGDAGLVRVSGAQDIELGGLSVDATGKLSRAATISARALPGSTGRAGELQPDGSVLGVSIETQRLGVFDAAEVGSSTQGLGVAGDVVIAAAEAVTLTGGSAGPGQLTSDAIAPEGDPRVGDGGSILIDTSQLSLIDGGQITTSTRGTGNAGSVDIHADRVELRGATGENQSAIFAQTLAQPNFAAGEAGGVRIHTTGDVALSNGALIAVETRNESPAGSIEIDAAGHVSLDDATISARATADALAPSGSISIAAARGVFLSHGSVVESRSFGEGPAGQILIDAGPRFEARDSQVSTESITRSKGGGGVIEIVASDQIALTDSQIDTSVATGGGNGDGGDVHIDPTLMILNHSAIRADAQDGNGGNIFIVAGSFVTSADSVVSATSFGGGIQGTVVIESPEADLASERAQPAQQFLDAAGLLRTSCGAAASQASSFVVARVAGLPASPEGPLPAPLWDALAEAGAPIAGAPSPAVAARDARPVRVAALAGSCEAREVVR